MMFRILRRVLAGLLFAACAASAQVDISLRLEHRAYMRGEPVLAIVSITNWTGAAIAVGETNGIGIGFDVRDQSGHLIAPRADGPGIAVPAVLNVGPTTFTNDIAECYDLDGRSQYSVSARLEDGGIPSFSRKFFFDISAGAEIGSLSTRVGGGLVQYRLMLLTRDGHESLLLKTTDANGSVIGAVRDLGNVLRMYPPEMKIDGAQRLHVLHFAGPRQLFHHVVGSDGRILRKESFSGNYRTVRLQSTPDGLVSVRTVEGRPGDQPDVLHQRSMNPNLHR